MTDLNLAKIRRDFPLLSLRVNAKPLIYFDNAATTQKPRSVIDSLNQHYKTANANVHRGAHHLSNAATNRFEQARSQVAHFINANCEKEVIWCRGTTEAINLVANSLGNLILEAGDIILVSTSEHHANIVPWQLIAKAKGAHVIAISLDTQSSTHPIIDQQHYRDLLEKHHPKIVALGHISNALGVTNPIEKMIAQAKAHGAITLIDGAQSAAHLPIDVQALGCDFFCFSAHKCFGPTGIGALWGKAELLEKMPPWQGGGEMISKVSFEETTFNDIPFKFEAGTPAIADVLGFAAAINYLNQLDRPQVLKYEKHLGKQLAKGCAEISGVTVYSPIQDNLGIVSFSVADIHHQDIAVLLDQSGIAVRSGHHCAMPLMQALELPGTLRASVCFYNTQSEVDYFLESLQQCIHLLKPSESNESLALSTQTVSESHLIATVFPDSITIIEQLTQATSWQNRFSYLLQLATYLPAPDNKLLQDSNKLQECESGVWLAPFSASNETHYQAWSDARIMRGLLVMLISCKDQARADSKSFLEEVKLAQYLSSSRTNGVDAILKALT
jgi:cysteine desulfurase/selenocysteine lyase